MARTFNKRSNGEYDENTVTQKRSIFIYGIRLMQFYLHTLPRHCICNFINIIHGTRVCKFINPRVHASVYTGTRLVSRFSVRKKKIKTTQNPKSVHSVIEKLGTRLFYR